MTSLRLHFASVLGTGSVFLLTLWFNQSVFTDLEFAPGVHWIYVPAGVRLLCILLLGDNGALGVLLAIWLVDIFLIFPDDPIQAFIRGLIATAAPYLVYRYARARYDFNVSLANLTPKRLLLLVFGNAIASSVLHQIWFCIEGDTERLLQRSAVMLMGNLMGGLIVIYCMKGMVMLFDSTRRRWPMH